MSPVRSAHWTGTFRDGSSPGRMRFPDKLDVLLIWSAATAGSPREHLAWGAVVAAFPKALTSQRTP
ncbi:MAG: hypothetical protein ACR2H4_00840 [Pyrinomonadaceae bacterium]